MTKESRDGMTDAHTLRERAYRDTSRLDSRKAIYQYTTPHYSIEDEVLGLRPLNEGQSLLDVGCGTGKLLLKAAKLQPKAHLTGVDLADGMYKPAQLQTQAEGLDITFQQADVQQLPFNDASFDRVTAMHMLYHAPNIDKAIGELSRVVKQDGLVMITANSSESRKQLGALKAQAGEIMEREVFTDPNLRFNLENGVEMVSNHFEHVALIPFESTLRLTEAQPYLDYFDSLREFWQPSPTDEQWEKVMASTKTYVENEIATKGAFTDRTGFGVIVASHSPLPPEIVEKEKAPSEKLTAVILAGGRGVRMGELTDDQQKCMLPVEGKPILGHIIDNLEEAFGEAKLVIATGYHDEQIREAFGNRRGPIDIEYVHNPERLETRKRLQLTEDLVKGPFLYMAGDVIVNPSQLTRVVERYRREKRLGNSPLGVITGATDHQPALSHALIEEKDGHATRMIYPPTASYIPDQLREVGVAYFDHGFFDRLRRARPDQTFLSHIISEAISEGEDFAVERYTDNWYHFFEPKDLNATIRYSRVN